MTNFGERLKNLRKSADVTQEQLANVLGISFQTVSKWETGLGLPDITLLPRISTFFGVSADWLLGISNDNTDEVIEKTLEEVFRLKHIAKSKEGIKLLEDNLKAYPNNHKLLAELITLKVHTFEPNCDKDEWLKEIEEKANIVLRDCTDDYERYKAKLALTFAYSFCGKRENAEKLCDTFPDEAYSRVEMYSMIAPPKKRIEYKKKCIGCDITKILVDILSVAKHHFSFADPKDAIPVCNIALNIAESLGNEGFIIGYTAESYSDLAIAYAKLKDKENTIKNMRLAFEQYSALDSLSSSGEYYYNSPLLKGESFNKSKIEYYAPISFTQQYIDTVSKLRSYDWLREDANFISLYKEMQAKIIPYNSGEHS